MKKLIPVLLITLLIAIPCLSKQADAEKEVARTQEFIAATQLKGAAKIDALKAYIKKFPETSSRWTRLAHYHLSLESFQTQQYADAVKYAEQTLKLESTPEEEGRLYLITANSYGVKSASIFDKDKALQWAQKAISFAQAKGLNDVLSEARKLKKQLSGPPPKKISPEQQIKMHYSNEEYSEAISFYQKLGAADKSSPEIYKTYANALFKANQFDSALKEFEALYSKEKKAIYALRIGDIYAAKAKRNSQFFGSAVDYYLEASVLYYKEGSSNNGKIAFDNAEFHLFEKYGFNKKINAYNEKLKKNQSSSQKNEAEIRRLERELRSEERRLRKEYPDIDPPDFEIKKIEALEKRIEALKSGAAPGSDATDEGAKLKEERNRIKKELNDLLAKAKTRLGIK